MDKMIWFQKHIVGSRAKLEIFKIRFLLLVVFGDYKYTGGGGCTKNVITYWLFNLVGNFSQPLGSVLKVFTRNTQKSSVCYCRCESICDQRLFNLYLASIREGCNLIHTNSLSF